MTAQHFILPATIGAANVQVFSPDGAPLMEQRLATPGDRLEFDARESGVFQVRIDPVGEPAWLTPVEVDANRSEDLSQALVRATAPTSTPRLHRVPLTSRRQVDPTVNLPTAVPAERGRKSASRDLVSVGRASRYLTFPFEAGFGRPNRFDLSVGARLLAVESPIPPPPPIRRLTVGVSIDVRPFRDGGWRPYEGPWDIAEGDQDARWTFDILRRPDDPPLSAKNARVRVHIALERTRILRLLAPLFQGGVRVTMEAREGDVVASVRPVDPTLHVLMQALGAGAEADPLRLLDHVAQASSPAMLEDPWAAVAFGLIAHRKHADAFTVRDALKLADECPWFVDASVIAASLLLADERPNVPEALRRLSHARKVGAPYFTVSSAMLGDLLVILAADAEEADVRATARRELRLWRKRLPFQSATGAYFAWVTQGGARNGGHVDARYVRPVFQGLVAPGVSGSLDLVPEIGWEEGYLLDLPSVLAPPRLAILDESDD